MINLIPVVVLICVGLAIAIHKGKLSKEYFDKLAKWAMDWIHNSKDGSQGTSQTGGLTRTSSPPVLN